MQEPFSLRANVCFRTRSTATGATVAEVWVHNLALTSGKRLLLAASGGKSLADYQTIAVGTGTVPADAGDTALGAELARATATATNPTPDSLQQQVTFAAGTATGTVTEGLLDFDDPNTGEGLCRAVVGPGVVWDSSHDLIVAWQLSLG